MTMSRNTTRFATKVVVSAGLCGAALALSPDAAAAPLKTGGYACIEDAAGAVAAPVVVGFFGGTEMLGGLLAGVTASGVLLALFQSNAGGAWDNAKKHIEGGHFGGKGSEAHKAAVVGDTVGDPFKDTAGPSLNILIKLMSVISVVIAPLLVK